MNEPRKLRPVIIEGPFRSVPVEEWAERHRRAGHHPQPMPTNSRYSCGRSVLNQKKAAEERQPVIYVSGGRSRRWADRHRGPRSVARIVESRSCSPEVGVGLPGACGVEAAL